MIAFIVAVLFSSAFLGACVLIAGSDSWSQCPACGIWHHKNGQRSEDLPVTWEGVRSERLCAECFIFNRGPEEPVVGLNAATRCSESVDGQNARLSKMACSEPYLSGGVNEDTPAGTSAIDTAQFGKMH